MRMTSPVSLVSRLNACLSFDSEQELDFAKLTQQSLYIYIFKYFNMNAYFSINLRGRIIMKTVEVEVIGVEPPCPRCKKTLENAMNAASKLHGETGAIANVNKLNVSSKEVADRYGVITTPAVAVNGVVRIMGKVPDVGILERILRKEFEAD